MDPFWVDPGYLIIQYLQFTRGIYVYFNIYHLNRVTRIWPSRVKSDVTKMINMSKIDVTKMINMSKIDVPGWTHFGSIPDTSYFNTHILLGGFTSILTYIMTPDETEGPKSPK